MAKGDLVFVDVETTGLDWDKHHVIEIAYMTEAMEKPVVVIPWGYDARANPLYTSPIWANANPKAMAINKFYERYPDGIPFSGDEAIHRMMNKMQDSTLVGANVRFDARMIEKFLGFEPWHHRLLDIEAYASGVFGWTIPLGWNRTVEFINSIEPGAIVLNDHTAAADCLSVMQAYRWLVANHSRF